MVVRKKKESSVLAVWRRSSQVERLQCLFRTGGVMAAKSGRCGEKLKGKGCGWYWSRWRGQ